MGKRSATQPLPTKRSKVVDDKPKPKPAVESKVRDVVQNFLKIYVMKKEGKSFLHAPLKAMLNNLFGINLKSESGLISIEMNLLHKIKTAKNAVDAGSMTYYSRRASGNSDLEFCGFTLRQTPTNGQSNSAEYKSLKNLAQKCNLDEAKVFTLYQAKLQTSSVTPAKKITRSWPECTNKGGVTHNGVKCLWLMVESGCTKLVPDSAKLSGSDFTMSFKRTLPSTNFTPGVYDFKYRVPDTYVIDFSKEVVIEKGGNTMVYIPLASAVATAKVNVGGGSWESEVPDDLRHDSADEGSEVGEVSEDVMVSQAVSNHTIDHDDDDDEESDDKSGTFSEVST